MLKAAAVMTAKLAKLPLVELPPAALVRQDRLRISIRVHVSPAKAERTVLSRVASSVLLVLSQGVVLTAVQLALLDPSPTQARLPVILALRALSTLEQTPLVAHAHLVLRASTPRLEPKAAANVPPGLSPTMPKMVVSSAEKARLQTRVIKPAPLVLVVRHRMMGMHLASPAQLIRSVMARRLAISVPLALRQTRTRLLASIVKVVYRAMVRPLAVAVTLVTNP
jgi:hypothetical protein